MPLYTPWVPAAGVQPNNLFQFRVYCTYRGQTAINTFYYACLATGETGVTLTMVNNYLNSIVSGPYRAWLTNGATFYGNSIKAAMALGPPQLWTQPVYSSAGSGVGTGGTAPMPTQDCGLNSWETETAGPSGRGRTYWPFPDTSAMDAATGLFDAGGLAQIADMANTVSGALSGFFLTTSYTGTGNTTLSPVLYAYGGQAYKYILSLTVRSGVATQRKRGTNFGRTNAPPF